MKKIILLALILALTGCIRVHKMDVEQGNSITPEMISRLHLGMSEGAVKALMGTPLLTNTFSEGREDYVYTYRPGYGEFLEKNITLIFMHGTLSEIRGNMVKAR